MSIRGKVRELIVLCLILLTILSLTWSQQIASYAQQERDYKRLATFLNNVISVTYSYSSSSGNAGEIGYKRLGEETVDGEKTWKVELFLKAKGEEEERAILWISESTGYCLQIEYRGTVIKGDLARSIALALLTPWFNWVDAYVEAWNPHTLYVYTEHGYGRLIFLGPEVKTFGPTELLTYKYRWEAYANAPEAYRGTAEWWFAPVRFDTLFGGLFVYFHGESDGEWLEIKLLSIELVNPQPRPNIVIDARPDKTRLKPNEETTITIIASNTGDAMGTHNLTITVNGEVKKSWLVVLNPGESKSLSHELSFAADGSYTVEIGDKTFTITVSTTPPAKFEISNLSINPASIRIGQSSTISVTVKNTGGESGSYEVVLKVNNQVVETKTGTLSPGQSTTVSFTYVPTSEGTYAIDVNGLAGSLTASREAMQEIPWLIIAGVLVAVVIIAIVVLLLRRKPKEILPPPPPPPPV